MKILVTGAAGFIGFHLCRRLTADGHDIIGLDNLNSYYNPALKLDRLKELGIDNPGQGDCVKAPGTSFSFIKADIKDNGTLQRLFDRHRFDTVINLAAQAGVRYSIENPRAYIESNIDGFLNILECCRDTKVGHLIFASSSSVYGLNGNVPFSESDSIAHPVSVYAATKKSGELLAHAYSSLFGMPVTGLRFFTVYGPWGRPDMSPHLFADAIFNNRPIKVFNNGNMERDFTYIDDVVESITRLLSHIPQGNSSWDAEVHDPATSPAPYRIYNIGNSSPTRLMDFISAIEHSAGLTAVKEMLPMQQGDVVRTWADSSALYNEIGFKPTTLLADGIDATVKWHRQYYKTI